MNCFPIELKMQNEELHTMQAALDSDGESVIRVVMSDITERKQVEAEKAELEAQNRQLQKWDTIRHTLAEKKKA